ncbi:NAC domain containing protein [Melia azedarach]|uniref:NAC domain containing protein n=1 Tax=Melia azedarach TaxID=155640 RepID=A0ACC1YVZ9_MELAZ|nr:NAC domain containing protein [Melia azedarach]
MDYNYLGYRFRPSGQEIITFFLDRKMRGDEFPVRLVQEVAICKFEPWELPRQSVIPDDEEWCFFNKPSPKYANSGRTDRTTKAGFWKVTGKDLAISDDSGEQVIGFKKTLVFYRGRGSNAVKTSWVIHEYHSKNASANYQKPFVLCRLKGNLDDKPENYTRGESSRHAASNF